MVYSREHRIFLLLLLTLPAIASSIFSQTWKDDSLVVRQILDTNGLDTVQVNDVVKGKDSDGRIKNLYFWNLPHFQFVPSSIGNLNKLMELKIGYTDISSLPVELGNLIYLTILDLKFTKLTVLPREIGKFDSLRTLYITNNEITSIPTEIGNCRKLYYLQIQNNKITILPDGICNCDSLKTINAENNLISYIPENIGNIPAFHSIFLNNNRLKHVPNSLIPFSLDDVRLCDNDSLVFTPEQKSSWNVKDYKDYYQKYCNVDIQGGSGAGKSKQHTAPMQISDHTVILLVAHPGKVSCKVYDMRGKLVQILLDRSVTAGTHTIPWNRERCSHGVYMLRYTAGKGDSFSKAVVVK
jgi:hypothetical protein